MRSKIHKYIENSIEKNGNLFNAEVIKFPSEKKIQNSRDLSINKSYSWKLYDKTNINEDYDQLKAVVGICFMLGTLTVMGLYSNLI